MRYKLFLSFTILLSCTFLLLSCTKNDTTAAYTNYGQYYFSGVGNASQIVPANANDSSIGNAVFSGTYDSTLQVFNYSLSWSGLTSKVTSMNFYAGADSGQVAPLDRNIATYNSTSYLPTSYYYTSAIWSYSKLTGTEFNNLKNNKWYFIINTQNFSVGELRGQIKFTGKSY